MHQQLCLRLRGGYHLSSKINAEQIHSTSRKMHMVIIACDDDDDDDDDKLFLWYG